MDRRRARDRPRITRAAARKAHHGIGGASAGRGFIGSGGGFGGLRVAAYGAAPPEIVGFADVTATGALHRREEAPATRADARVLSHLGVAEFAEIANGLQFESFLEVSPAVEAGAGLDAVSGLAGLFSPGAPSRDDSLFAVEVDFLLSFL